ncbi:histamine H3 receptor-like isoform X2 [Takifugu rubripes]|uniref:histamine H3 receptor-like isoform X2 n=1 Tax=Takifugu rubripes TaxID=31033 RepID=UPI0011456059|nr:histamine H3 receptor-like isoform X2 [Takifugu rubripes]
MSEGESGSYSSLRYLTNVTARIQSSSAFSGPVFVLLMAMMVTLVVVIVLGNALVILAFKVDKSLRRQCNYYFLNLAISDFLVGAFCIPVYIPYTLTGRWTLGRGLCKLWLVMDYLLCSASVFNIVLISYDRFLSVTRAVSYRARQSLSHQAVIKMIAVWVLAFVLYGPAIIFWELLVGRSRVPKDECFAEFYYSWSFLLSASTLEFFSPFISVAFFNLSIYLSIRRRRRRSGDTHLHLQLSEPAADQGEGVPLSNTSGLKLTRIVSIPSQSSSPSIGKLDPSPSRSIHPSRLSRDKKIAKSLAIIVCVFAICWAPYTLLMIIRAACRGRCIQHHCSFRRAFKKILCPGRNSTPTSALRASQ